MNLFNISNDNLTENYEPAYMAAGLTYDWTNSLEAGAGVELPILSGAMAAEIVADLELESKYTYVHLLYIYIHI